MLDSPAEQREIVWGSRTWIGLHRDSSNNSRWQWIDGSLVVYLNFTSNQPNNWNGTEDCVEINPSRKWNVLNCNTSLHYSCELSSGRSRYFQTNSFIFKATYRNCFLAFSFFFFFCILFFFKEKSHNGVD